MTGLHYEIADDAMIGRAVLVERAQKGDWLDRLNALEYVTATVMHEILISEGERTLVDRSYLFVSVPSSFKSHSISGGLFVADAIAAVAGDSFHELVGDTAVILEMKVATERRYEWLRKLNDNSYVTAGLPDAAEDEDGALTRIYLSVPGGFRAHSISGGLFLRDVVESVAKELASA